MSEKTFLNEYDKTQFNAPLLTVDAVLFTYHAAQLKVLLVERGSYPEKGKWALPGGFVDETADNTLEQTIGRKLTEKTGVVTPYLEQLATFGGAKRDKRGWSVTVVYTALIAHQDCAAHVDSVSDTRWIALEELPGMDLAFDHADIIQVGRERLRQKALYSIVPAYALPGTFTLPELQRVHEVLIGKSLQKKSFRRRIEQAALLEDTGDKRSESGRPATLYRMKAGAGQHTFLRNLER